MTTEVICGEKRKFKITIIEYRCKECELCINICPKKVLEKSNKLNIRGYYVPKVANPEACIGCKLCENICPDFAIFITILDEDF